MELKSEPVDRADTQLIQPTASIITSDKVYELTDPSSNTQASPLLDTGCVMTPNIMESTLLVTTSNTSNKMPVSTDSNIAMLASSTHDTGHVMTSNTTETELHLPRPQPSTETTSTPNQDASAGKTTPIVLVEKLNITSDTVIFEFKKTFC